MSSKRDERFEGNLPIPEKKWYRPELTPEEREKYRREFQQEGGDYSLAKAQAVTIVKRVLGLKRHEKATRAVMEIADDIWLDGLKVAWKFFDPSRGAAFKTFLYMILQRKAWKVRRRFISKLPPKVLLNVVTVRHEGISYGIPDYQVDKNGKVIPWYLRFTFDFQTCDFSFLPCGLRLDNTIELVSDEILEIEQPRSMDSEGETERDHREFLQRVGTMTKKELLNHSRKHLPNSYKKLTDAKLEKELIRLDLEIVEMLIGDSEPATQVAIRSKLGITRYFYKARVKAILRRLKIPGDSMIRRVKATKRREKRKRHMEPITKIATDKMLIFSPPQPIFVVRVVNGETDTQILVQDGKARPSLEGKENSRWLDEADEPNDFVVNSSKPTRIDRPYAVDDSEHWELIEEFMEEE